MKLKVLIIICLLALTGCSMPSDGWFQRVETAIDKERYFLERIDVNTAALAKDIKDEAIKNEWLKEREQIQKPQEAPPDQNPIQDWIIYLVIAAAGAYGIPLINKKQIQSALKGSTNANNKS